MVHVPLTCTSSSLALSALEVWDTSPPGSSSSSNEPYPQSSEFDFTGLLHLHAAQF